MLISPPFLPARGDLTEEQWLNVAMACGGPGAGAYPVSANFDWHGGVHLTAPLNGTTPEPVRAIADGTIVFVRERREPNDHNDPLYYGGGYTSDGAVVIRHDQEIGVNAQNQAIMVRYYSLYHHLQNIRPKVILGRKILRKDEIGQAGHIYGTPNLIHFEIRCDRENLRKIIGRSEGDLPMDRDGRKDVIYGEIYFLLPRNTPIYSQQPLPNNPEPRAATPTRPNTPASTTLLQPTNTIDEQIIVGLRYATGVGSTENLGDALIRSYNVDGSNIGQPIIQHQAEYNLYNMADMISKSYPPASRPASSTTLEMLRFGRTIGPDNLPNTNIPHWREIPYTNGRGWANLNASDIRKFSDADFPHWKGWKFIDDDTNLDARCDSSTLISWFGCNAGENIDPIESTFLLTRDNISTRMQKAICKIPSEWDESTLDNRWGWLKTKCSRNNHPMTETDYTAFTKHTKHLCIKLKELTDAQWAVHPSCFIKWMRAQIWVDENLFKRAYPSATNEKTALYRTDINKAIRKYGIQSVNRIAHFLGQAAVESGQLAWMNELYSGDPFEYFRRYEKAKNFNGWLGNIQWDDGGRFRGRGFKQLTGRSNYASYWVYRGWLSQGNFNENWWRTLGWWGLQGNTLQTNQINTLPTRNQAQVDTLIASTRPPEIRNPELISTDTYACIDTAGWFWAKNSLLRYADINNAAEMTRRIRGDSAAVGATLPWPAAAHYPERLANTNRLATLFGDT